MMQGPPRIQPVLTDETVHVVRAFLINGAKKTVSEVRRELIAARWMRRWISLWGLGDVGAGRLARQSCFCRAIVTLPQEVATDGVREASRSHAFDSPSPGEHMGEGGCIFDEIGNLVEPTERLHMDVQAGPQRSRMRRVSGANSPARRRTE
jgi:hypothetical protein